MGCAETSLVVQWLRVHLSVQGTQNQTLTGGTKFPRVRNQPSLYVVTVEKPTSCNEDSAQPPKIKK